MAEGQGLLPLGRARATRTSTRCRACSPCSSATAAPSSPRRRATQAEQLEYFPIWSYAHPPAIELAAKLADLAPGDLNRVFFTTGGSEAVESAWKLARQYFRAIGQPERYKVIARETAYHGTTMGALAITGVPALRDAVRAAHARARRTCRTPTATGTRSARTTKPRSCGSRPTRSRSAILVEGPETVAAVYLEPVQNAGGCFVPPDGLLPAGARDLRPLRRAARLRRGHLRVRPARHDVRLRALRLPARHDHVRQGPHQRVLAARRGDLSRLPRRAVPRGHRELPARHHVRRPPGELRGRRCATSSCSRRRTSSSTCAANEAEFRGRHRGPARPPDRRRRARRRLLPRASSWWRTRRPDAPLHQASRARRCSAASSRPALYEAGLDLPRRRPRRPGRPALAAARSPGPRSSTRSRPIAAHVPHRGLEAACPQHDATGVGDAGRRRPARGQGRRAPRRDHARRRARARRTHGVTVLVEHGRGRRLRDHRRRVPRRRRRDRRRRRRRSGRAPGWSEGEGAAGRRVRATSGPASCCSPTSTSPRTPRSPRRCSSARYHRHRLRDRAARRRRAAAARADERGRGAHGDPGRARTSSSARTAAAACCSAARPACGRRASWCSAPATSAGTRRGSRQGMEAEVLLLDKNLDRLRWVDQIHQGRIMTLASNRGAVERARSPTPTS